MRSAVRKRWHRWQDNHALRVRVARAMSIPTSPTRISFHSIKQTTAVWSRDTDADVQRSSSFSCMDGAGTVFTRFLYCNNCVPECSGCFLFCHKNSFLDDSSTYLSIKCSIRHSVQSGRLQEVIHLLLICNIWAVWSEFVGKLGYFTENFITMSSL